jgi:hypothetical protein
LRGVPVLRERRSACETAGAIVEGIENHLIDAADIFLDLGSGYAYGAGIAK